MYFSEHSRQNEKILFFQPGLRRGCSGTLPVVSCETFAKKQRKIGLEREEKGKGAFSEAIVVL